MTHPTPATDRAQFRGLFRSLVLDPALLLGRALSEETIARAIADEAGKTGDRVFTPATFLSQVNSDDHSCRVAVARLKGWRAARGLPACSLATGGYCKARQRLPEALLPRLVRELGDGLQKRAPDGWLFHGREVVVVDGSGVGMPDTPENQAAYPQHSGQNPGCGFPLARIVVLLSLATGAALDLGIARTTGELTGENALLRGLRGRLKRGDVLLADSYYSSYPEVAALRAMGVDVMSRREFAALPRSVAVRELRVRVDKPGFRTKVFVAVTTLLDPKAFPPGDPAGLYRQRWNCELDVRTLKQTMRMDVPRCKAPETIRKEASAHLLVYNLVRGVVAEAAARHGVCPRVLSFQGARQVLEGFRPELAKASPGQAAGLRGEALSAIAGERVGDRPDRYEPRARKRREKMHARLQEPRQDFKKRFARAS